MCATSEQQVKHGVEKIRLTVEAKLVHKFNENLVSQQQHERDSHRLPNVLIYRTFIRFYWVNMIDSLLRAGRWRKFLFDMD